MVQFFVSGHRAMHGVMGGNEQAGIQVGLEVYGYICKRIAEIQGPVQ